VELSALCLKEWVKKIDVETLPCGAAGFFDAILEKRSNIKENYDDTSFDDNKNTELIVNIEDIKYDVE